MTTLSSLLTEWESNSSFDKTISRLREHLEGFRKKQARFASDPALLNLRIGIMGRVKAGKSTFLNALLFDGQPVLPQAATPKTANLTRITWGERHALQVEFYSLDEWQTLCRLAGRPNDNSPEAKVARELQAQLREARLSEAEVQRLLVQPVQTHEANDLPALMALMNEYVGNDGRYTPLVKMTHLFMPLPELKGFDVVDTPGMNDPVASRTQKTREFMQECDVVFFLSPAGQFLDKSDIDLLTNQIPGGGVRRMVLVACQIDSAVESEANDCDWPTLKETLDSLRGPRLGRPAEENIENFARRNDEAGEEWAERSVMLRKLKTPIFSSTFAYGLATWPAERWSEDMRLVYNQLNDVAARLWNQPQGLTKEQWLEIANFAPLRQAYDEERALKAKTLQQQKDKSASDAASELKKQLGKWRDDAADLLHRLQTQDLATLQQEQAALEKNLKDIARPLQELIGQAISKAREASQGTRNGLRETLEKFNKLKTRSGTREETRWITVSAAVLWNPFSWFRTKEVPRTRTFRYDYLSAADAVESVERFERECVRSIERTFESLLDPYMLIAQLKKALNDVLARQKNYNPAAFRRVMDDALDRLDLPTLFLPTGRASQAIASRFSGEITSSGEQSQLQNALNDALQSVFETLLGEFESSSHKLFERLQAVQNSLQATLSASLKADLEQARHDFANQQQQARRYEALLAALKPLIAHPEKALAQG